MRRGQYVWRSRPFAAVAVLVLLAGLGLMSAGALADNTDQNSTGVRFAWSENLGWLKARPAGEPYAAGGSGMQVSDTDVTGFLWSENAGWINLSCKNDGGAACTTWGVKNDGAGHLSGYAWSENKGWISFSCNNTPGYCGTVNYGVTIATPGTYDYLRTCLPHTCSTWGIFHGQAWAENAGWIRFNCNDDSTCLTTNYAAQTGWPNTSGDGYTDARHIALGKDPFKYCKIMRADVNGDKSVNILDLSTMAAKFGQSVPPAPARLDQNADTTINILDLSIAASVYGQSVTACP
jgi:Dockerin type I domain